MSSVFLQPNVSDEDCRRYSPWFWPVLTAAGIATGLVAGALMWLLHLIQHLAYRYAAGSFLDGTEAVSWERRLLVVTAAGLLAGAALAWFRRRPALGGPTDLNGAIWFHDGSVAARATSARALLSIVLVGLGASLGREQAPKQMGAVLAGLGAARFGLRAAERRLLVACGAGAGVAAVYDVPFGGALFALEVLLGTMTLPLVAPAVLMSVLAVVSSWALLPDAATYVIPVHATGPGIAMLGLLAGPPLGLASVAFTRAVAWTDRLQLKGLQVAAAPVVVFAGLGLTGALFPGVLGNGRNLVQSCFDDGFAVPLLLCLALLKPVATIACLGSGAPGGLFTPTIASGALLGALGGHLIRLAFPSVAIADATLLGAAGMLAGTTLGPVSSIMLMLELTRSGQGMLVPILLTVAGAIVTARTLDSRTVYSARIHLGRGNADHADGEISSAARAEEILCRLLPRGPDSEPLVVVDEHGRALGAIDRAAVAAHGIAPLAGHAGAIANAGDLAWHEKRGLDAA